MQKVERKKHNHRQRKPLVWLILCAILLVAGVTAGIILRNRAKEETVQTRQRVSGAITQRNIEDLESLTVIQRGKEPWTAVREEDGSLRLQPENENEPNTWVVDTSIANMLADAAVNLTYEDVFTENREDWEPHKADFGLEEPKITAVIRFTDGTEVTAHIGDSADGDENAYYYLTVEGDDRLYAIAAGTVQDLNTERELMHPVHQLEIRGALLDRITVKNGDGSIRQEWALEGQVSDQDAAENWLVKVPYEYPADYDAMKNLRDTADNLTLGIYIGNAEEEALEQCGLAEPSSVIEFHMAAGSTGTVSDAGVYDVTEREEGTETIKVGSAKSDMVAYVQYGDEIYTINHFSLETFTKTNPLSTVARYIAATPLNSLNSVTVEKQDADAVQYTVERVENTDGETAETEYRCLRNGEEISWDTFSAAWERLLTVTVSGRLPADYIPKETHTKYTFRSVSGGTYTVELSDYDGMHDAVTMDGHTLFYLIKSGMTELP